MPTRFDTQTGHDRHGLYPEAETVEDFQRNLAAVQARIAAACHRSGRDPATVRLLPVSKTKPEASLRLAYAAGCRYLGENKVQEAFSKWQGMQDLTDLHWSVIGHLQTNKAKVVARFASEFQALDSLRLARHWSGVCRPKGEGWTYSCRSTPRVRRASTGCLRTRSKGSSANCPLIRRCVCGDL